MFSPNAKQSFTACTDMSALIQGAPSRLHDATVVLLAAVYVPVRGAAIGGCKNGGQGSRAWSPPV